MTNAMEIRELALSTTTDLVGGEEPWLGPALGIFFFMHSEINISDAEGGFDSSHELVASMYQGLGTWFQPS